MNTKKTIHVLIHIGDFPLAKEIKKNVYSGYCYDLWKIIKSRLSTKYNFIEESYQTSTYNKIIDIVNQQKYDIAISMFNKTLPRMQNVLYTFPIFINNISIVYIPENKAILNTLFNTYTKYTILLPLLIIIILSIITGSIQYIYRNRYIETVSMSNYIINSVLSIMRVKNIINEGQYIPVMYTMLIIIISIISFYIISIIHAFYTSYVVRYKQLNKIKLNPDNIANKKFLSIRGYAVATIFEKMNVNIKYIDGSINDCIQYYIKHKNDYDGVAISSLEANYYTTIYKQLSVNKDKHEYGTFFNYWITNTSQPDLVADINSVLLDIDIKKKMSKICIQYTGKYCYL